MELTYDQTEHAQVAYPGIHMQDVYFLVQHEV
jgi:hypothetical protein